MKEKLSNEIKKILWGNKIFSELSSVDTFVSDAGVYLKEYTSGDVIVDAQSYQPAVAVVIRGKVNVFGRSDGKELLLKSSTKGDVFGLAGLFCDEAEYSSRVIASSKKTIVLFIDQSVIEREINSNPSFSFAYIRLLSEKIRYLNSKIGHYTAESVEKRLCSYLSEHACFDCGQGLYVCSLNYQKVSKLLDISRASIYRARESLEKRGLIQIVDRAIVIKDPDALKKYITA